MTRFDHPELPCCTWCGFPIISRDARYMVSEDGRPFCGNHCRRGFANDPTRDANGRPYPRSGGHSAPEHCETWTHWLVFDNVDIAQELAEHSEPDDLAAALTGWSHSYNGAGQAFNHAPCARVGRFHTLVTQHGGMDV